MTDDEDDVDARYKYPPRYYSIESARGMEDDEDSGES